MTLILYDQQVLTMEGLNDKKLMIWKKKRRQTFGSFILVGVLVGIEHSIVFTTLYLYLRDTIKTEHCEVYYGLIIALHQTMSAVLGVFVGRWLDKTRRVRLFANITILLQIVGSLLYLVPYHVCFPILGRLIAGAGDIFMSLCSGEVVRMYNEKEGMRALWWLAVCDSLGMVLGPLIMLAFAEIEFKIGPMIVNQYNFVGVFMALLFIVALVIVNYLIHDCSKEFDFKKDTEMKSLDRESNGNTIRIISNIQAPPSALLTIRKLCANKDVALLFASEAVCMYAMFSVDELIPLVFFIILEWKPEALGGFFMATGLIYAMLLFLLSKYCTSNVSLYIIMVVCLIGSVLMYLTITIITLNDRSLAVDRILVVLLGFFWLLTTCTEEVLIRAILAKKVESSVQSFTEALRNTISNVAGIVAALTTPLVLPGLGIWASVMACVMGMVTVSYIVRKESLVGTAVIEICSSEAVVKENVHFENPEVHRLSADHRSTTPQTPPLTVPTHLLPTPQRLVSFPELCRRSADHRSTTPQIPPLTVRTHLPTPHC